MSSSNIRLAEIDLMRLVETESDYEAKISSWTSDSRARSVAIIGMDGKAGAAENLAQFWDMLIGEIEGVRDLPEQRRQDMEHFLNSKGIQTPLNADQYVRSTYLTDIAGFDYSFFGLSQQEAKYMDPHQRIFLETAWKALEDSGYGGEDIRGSDTGVFVGFSSDFGEDYRYLTHASAYDAPEIAVAGNVKSMIASRLSYHLNLRGPAFLIDTACSSGLMAMYQAVQAIRNGDCSMAVAGAVNCNVLPILENGRLGMGIIDIQNINSSSYHTCTFDDACDGTYAAEGSFAFVLKPLDQALQDGDTIRAVILGGATTQDGASNGITAPNSEAQEELIIRALNDASVSAEDVSYIEAHGTATPLGDPIEIDGIQRAFRHFTAKKQFCAVGSLKSNIGHLDNAAGLGGVAKVVLAMEHRILPASLNFRTPNRNIPFIETQVYVNDQTVPWEPSLDETLKAGINSFGLSGTNCHLVIESAPSNAVRQERSHTGPLFLPLSARTPEALHQLAEAYLERISNSDVDLVDAVYTASCGRMHHRIRLAVLFENREQLCAGLLEFIQNKSASGNVDIRYGESRLVSREEDRRQHGDLTPADRQRLEEQALSLVNSGFERLSMELASQCADLYVTGIQFPWNSLFRRFSVRRIPLPTYPFQHSRCWIDPVTKREELENVDYTDGGHPLLDMNSITTIGHTLFRKLLQAEKYWVLAEHKVFGISLMPGTAMVEMMVAHAMQVVSSKGDPSSRLRFTDILFLSPFMLKAGEHKELHMLVESAEDRLRYQFASLSDENGEWTLHAEGMLNHVSAEEHVSTFIADLDHLKAQCNHKLDIDASEDLKRGLELGKRWVDLVAEGWASSDKQQILVELSLPEAYRSETNSYYLHPALMDVAVNAANNLLDKGELYLPLSYGELSVYRRLPARILVHLNKIDRFKDAPIQSFDIALYDPEGHLLANIKNYCIKSTSEIMRLNHPDSYGMKPTLLYYPDPAKRQLPDGAILIAGKTNEASMRLAQTLRDQGRKVIEVCPEEQGGWEQELRMAEVSEPWALAIFTWAPPNPAESNSIKWQVEAEEAVMQGFHFLKAWSAGRYKSAGGLVALTYTSWGESKEIAELHPGQSALGGLWQIGSLEFESGHLRNLDEDGQTPSETLLHELAHPDRPNRLVYRNGQAYIPDMERCELPASADQLILEGDGIYVISGGTGALGSAVARFLMQKGVRRIALLGHSPVPDKKKWIEMLESTSDVTLKDRLKVWTELDRQLDALEVCAVQIEEYTELEAYLSGLRARHGRIAGVLHLAGKAGDGFLFLKQEQTFRDVYSPKVNGAINLHLTTLNDQLEFFILFSSVSSLLHYPGQSDYTAANQFLDSLAELRRHSGLPALSLQWPAWREIGMAYRMGSVDETEKYAALDTQEALLLLERVLQGLETLPPVLMPGRVRQKLFVPKKVAGAAANINKTQGTVLHGLSELGEIELSVADIWSKTLGLNQLDADDEFSELGGNSLLTSQMLREYDKRYPGVMDIADLFTYTTVREQADYLKERLQRTELNQQAEALEKRDTEQLQGLDSDIDDILEGVAKGIMTVDESSSLLSTIERRKNR